MKVYGLGPCEIHAIGEDDVLRSERVKSIGEGHARCEEWRQALLAQGGWRELAG